MLHLPRELIVEILKSLDLKELLRCNVVCSSLRDIIKESLELQYHIELGADGLVDGIDCTLSTSERLIRLLRLRARWRYLDWTGVKPISAPAMCQAYELVDGVFASSMGDGLSRSRHLALTWLPTFREPGRTVERDDLGVTVRDFAIDPSQDLIALVIADEVASFNIHLRTMSEYKPHPQAAKPELKALIPFQVGNSSIQIVDDIVGTFFWVHGPGLLIWNWRTGKNIVHCIGFDLPTGAYDFAFLSNRAFMLTVTTGPGLIELYAFTGDGEAPTPSSSSSSSSTTTTTPTSGSPPLAPQVQSQWFSGRRLPTRVAVLLLPQTNPGRDMRKAFTHSAPFVGRPTSGRPFETSENIRVHMLTLHYGDHAGMFNLFVLNRFLLSFVPPGVGSSEDYGHVVKHWDEWGPENTRVFEWAVHFHWLRYIHGSRVVFPPIPERDPEANERFILMMDFNVFPKRTDDPVDAYQGPKESDCMLVTDERRIDAGPIFQEPVISKLPYLISTRGGISSVADYSGFMIDRERLVAMRSGESDYVNLDIYTF